VFIWGLAVVALFAFAFHFAYALSLKPGVAGDASFYRAVATHLARGEGYLEPFSGVLGRADHPTAQHPPAFVLYLAAWTKLGVVSVRGQQAACCVLGALNAVLTGVLGRRLAGPRVGIFAAVLAAVYPWLFMVEPSINSESLYFPLVTGALILAYACLRHPTSRRAALLGVIIGLATLTRPDGIFLLIFLAAPLMWRNRRLEVHALVACVAAAALVLSPWVVRNAIVFHEFPLISHNTGVTALYANCHATYYGSRLGFYAEACGRHSPCARLAEAPRSKCQQHAATAYIGRHLRRFPVVVVARMERAWEIYRPNDSLGHGALVWGRPRSVGQAALVVYVFVLSLALAGAFLLHRRGVPLMPLAGVAVQASFVAALAWGESRYRAAAEPALVVLAAVALASLAQGVGRRHPGAEPSKP
jgi:4-amino-4-deoxy-L-arabinose transferase-like glycosyltransferase